MTARCGICKASLPLSELASHLATHGFDLEAELERWPDGEPVVIDTTLEPEDFDG